MVWFYVRVYLLKIIIRCSLCILEIEKSYKQFCPLQASCTIIIVIIHTNLTNVYIYVNKCLTVSINIPFKTSQIYKKSAQLTKLKTMLQQTTRNAAQNHSQSHTQQQQIVQAAINIDHLPNATNAIVVSSDNGDITHHQHTIDTGDVNHNISGVQRVGQIDNVKIEVNPICEHLQQGPATESTNATLLHNIPNVSS